MKSRNLITYFSLTIFLVGCVQGSTIEKMFYYDSNDNLLASGKIKDGLKDGNWHYNLFDCEFDMDWKTYKKRDFEVCIPKSWDIRPEAKVILNVVGGGTCSDSAQFVLSVNSPSDPEQDINLEHYEKFVRTILEKKYDSLKTSYFNGTSEFLFVKYQGLSEAGEVDVNIISFFKINEHEIFNVFYYYLSDNEQHATLFLDFLINTRFKGKPIMTLEESGKYFPSGILEYKIEVSQ